MKRIVDGSHGNGREEESLRVYIVCVSEWCVCEKKTNMRAKYTKNVFCPFCYSLDAHTAHTMKVVHHNMKIYFLK
jgi:hypothetical protein